MDFADVVCDLCEVWNGSKECLRCPYGNPCLGCEDYDVEKNTCKSEGTCAG